MTTPDDRLTRVTRRTALRAWGAGVGPLLLLTACGGQSATTPTTAPASTPASAAPAASPVAAASPALSPVPAPSPALAASPSASPGTAASPVASPPTAASPSALASPAASPVAAASTGAGCTLVPEQTEGPYYIDTGLVRSDITEGRPGVPLQLTLLVQEIPSCRPLPNVLVEIWHCDALGEYSGFGSDQVQAQGEPRGSVTGSPAPKPGGPPPPKPSGGMPPGGGPPGGERQQPVNSMVFLRGGQMTDTLGQVSFQTIYPGWYRGRTVHIHFKVRTTPQAASGYSLTSQLYFDDSLSDRVYEQAPYSQKTGRDTRNSNDGIYADGGSQLTLPLTSAAGGGYTGAFAIGLRLA